MRAERVAIVGAGISGLQCARSLGDRGMDVTVFDKARGSGGRMATRRVDGVTFDHGAQYFTAREPEFVDAVRGWLRDGAVREWSCRLARLRTGVMDAIESGGPRYVGVPRMSSLTRHLANGRSIRTEQRITELRQGDDGWTLITKAGSIDARFGAVLLTVPAPQAVPLLSAVPALAARAASVDYSPCQAVMVEFDRPLELDYDAAFVEASPLSWVAREASKPARSERECWVLHASPEWSDRHLETPPDDVSEALFSAFARANRSEIPRPIQVRAHRWAYAMPRVSIGGPAYDAELGIGVCGDWCAGPRVEDAFLSGTALASRLLPGVR